MAINIIFFTNLKICDSIRAMVNKHLELSGYFDLDSLRYCLQNQLTTKELVEFALSLRENLTDEEGFTEIVKDITGSAAF